MARIKDDYVFKLKGGEASALESVNPFLERREPIVVFFENGQTNIKIGDGKNNYNNLPFISDTNIDISDVQGLTEILHQYEIDLENMNEKIDEIVTDIETNIVGRKTPEGGEIFNDYENNRALEYSHAEGTNNYAGGKGFTILEWSPEDPTCFQLNTADGLEVGDEYSCQLTSNFDLVGKIVNIEENRVVYVDVAPIANAGDTPVWTETSTFWIPTKPECGDTQIGKYSHAEGYGNIAAQIISHAEGYANISAGKYSHTEGRNNIAVYAAHAEGHTTKALGKESHSEGSQTTAKGNNAHAEGYLTNAEGIASHAEGGNTQAIKGGDHAEGGETIANGGRAHAEGSGSQALGYGAHAEGQTTIANGQASHTEGGNTKTNEQFAHAEGYSTNASGFASHAEGRSAKAEGQASHAEGDGTQAIGMESHTEGNGSIAQGRASHAEGIRTNALVRGAHSEGEETTANADAAHAEGKLTNATGYAAHAEGEQATAEGQGSHAEGFNTVAKQSAAHAEGYATKADGRGAHAEGLSSTANGGNSHAEGKGTIAYTNQHVEGKYNTPIEDENIVHIIGNGTSNNNRSNAHTVDYDGNAWYQGSVKADKGFVAGDTYVSNAYIGGNISHNLNSNDFNTSYVSLLPTVTLNDGLPIGGKIHSMRIVNKNLVPYLEEETIGGITFSQASDGIKMSGISNIFGELKKVVFDDILSAGTYTVKGIPSVLFSGYDTEEPFYYWYYVEIDGKRIEIRKNDYTFNLSKNTEVKLILYLNTPYIAFDFYLPDGVEYVYCPCQIEQGNISTAYQTPIKIENEYIENFDIVKCGKNLLPKSQFRYGIVPSINGGHDVEVDNGMASTNFISILDKPMTFTVNTTPNANVEIFFYNGDGQIWLGSGKNRKLDDFVHIEDGIYSFTIDRSNDKVPSNAYYYKIRLDNVSAIVWTQMEIGDIFTGYDDTKVQKLNIDNYGNIYSEEIITTGKEITNIRIALLGEYYQPIFNNISTQLISTYDMDINKINFSSSDVNITVDQTYNANSENAQSGKAVAQAIQESLSDIETALDSIIAIQNSLIGGSEV